MVCMDGFILTHATERVDLPDQEQVDAFLPPFEPRQVLDPDDPYSIGAMVGPEAFEEVRYLAHARQLQALERIRELAREFAEAFGRDSGGLVHPYRSADADVVVVAMGSVLGTIKDVVDAQRDAGHADRRARHHVVPALPDRRRARRASESARRVVVVEKAFSVGFGGVLSTDVAMALSGLPVPVATVVAGLGGRPITKASLQRCLRGGRSGASSERLTFLDLNRGPRRARARAHGRAAPLRARRAENILRDLGVVALGDRLSRWPSASTRWGASPSATGW